VITPLDEFSNYIFRLLHIFELINIEDLVLSPSEGMPSAKGWLRSQCTVKLLDDAGAYGEFGINSR